MLFYQRPSAMQSGRRTDVCPTASSRQIGEEASVVFAEIVQPTPNW